MHYSQSKNCESFSFAFILCSSFILLTTMAIVATNTPKSSLKPTIGVTSGIASRGEIKYPSAAKITAFTCAGVSSSFAV